MQLTIVTLLVVGNHPEYIVHLQLALLRLKPSGVWVGHVDVHQIGEEEAQVGNAWQFQALDVQTQAAPVVFLREHLGQLVKCVALFFVQISPSLC